MVEEFDATLQNFNSMGSSWSIDRILDFSVTLAPYRPMQGSSFIPTLAEIANKKAIINIPGGGGGGGGGMELGRFGYNRYNAMIAPDLFQFYPRRWRPS